jgi:hypothetical protein
MLNEFETALFETIMTDPRCRAPDALSIPLRTVAARVCAIVADVADHARSHGWLVTDTDYILYRKPPTPTPTTRRYTVEGTVHLAGGFNISIEAETTYDARDKVQRDIEDMSTSEIVELYGVSLQEVCIQNAVEEE